MSAVEPVSNIRTWSAACSFHHSIFIMMLGESTQPWKHFHLIGTNSSIAKGTTDLRFECPSTTTWYYRKRQFQESLVSSFATSKHLLLFMNLLRGEGLLYNMYQLSIRPICQVSSRSPIHLPHYFSYFLSLPSSFSPLSPSSSFSLVHPVPPPP